MSEKGCCGKNIEVQSRVYMKIKQIRDICFMLYVYLLNRYTRAMVRITEKSNLGPSTHFRESRTHQYGFFLYYCKRTFT